VPEVVVIVLRDPVMREETWRSLMVMALSNCQQLGELSRRPQP
jgi:hypothetical protein